VTELAMPAIEPHPFQARWYLNGFPKSGLHWLALMMEPIAGPMPVIDGALNKPWAGTFTHNAWSTNWTSIEKWSYKASLVQPGYFLYGHCGHSEEVEHFLRLLGVAHVFIYRDLRDVVVSQAHHVTNNDNGRFRHPNKGIYLQMDSLEDVIGACITGIGDYPGVLERWEQYAGWLDVDWVLKVRFEELAADAKAVARRLLRYGLARTANIYGVKLVTNEDVFEHVAELMVDSGNAKHKSRNYRRGQVGGWHEHFTPELTGLFKKADKNDWLRRLGYEQSDSWQEEAGARACD